MPRFDGRVVFITGGARGQGREHAVHFARAGADVVLVDVPEQVESVPYPLGTCGDLHETVALVEKQGRRALAIEADVRRSNQMRAAVEQAIDEFGAVDILVANAGIVTYRHLSEMDDQMWQDTIDVNLTGVANTVRAVLGHMLEQRYGRIVVTSSQAGRRGVPNLAHYSASKWGLIGLVKSVALEVAPALGITCNAVLPGGVDTPMMHHDEVYAVFAPDVPAPTRADLEERLGRLNPMPITWIEPSDISHAVLHLASEEARYVSGATIDVAAAFNANNS
ncbi:mycofactocin-coupled SDR family oxidoreductase [Saccharopolyspora spinosa]|uniref:SDR family mycofactocin-dependent oxidoreductase n=1 Tax=Saccharopolyspora spinosa TaxID=60894 RepID=A0A2N3Y1S2_SACSN|nr:mycofactocin-coupled SDR family oxidoreductase [Saccharopolyspora spinosa]PKW16863.1 SDR family mycofactocin-dependent oxidoreductase [Saccharopolyspora spinosa]